MKLSLETNPTAGMRRTVVFQIENITDEEEVMLTKYGHPPIEFVPGNSVGNDWIWLGSLQVAIFDTPLEAEAHIQTVANQFKQEIASMRDRWNREGRPSTKIEVEA